MWTQSCQSFPYFEAVCNGQIMGCQGYRRSREWQVKSINEEEAQLKTCHMMCRIGKYLEDYLMKSSAEVLPIQRLPQGKDSM